MALVWRVWGCEMEKVVWGGSVFERVPEGWLQYVGPVERDRFGDIRERTLRTFGGTRRPATVFLFPNLRKAELPRRAA